MFAKGNWRLLATETKCERQFLRRLATICQSFATICQSFATICECLGPFANSWYSMGRFLYRNHMVTWPLALANQEELQRHRLTTICKGLRLLCQRLHDCFANAYDCLRNCLRKINKIHGEHPSQTVLDAQVFKR